MSKLGNKKNTRPLGSMRHSVSSLDKLPQIPRLVNSAAETRIEQLDERYRGIQGNAMTVPQPTAREKPHTENAETERVKSSGKSSASSIKPRDMVDKKELKDALAREKELKLTIANLEKIIEELRALLAQKETEIVGLHDTLKEKEKEHKLALDSEQKKHGRTKSMLEQTKAELEEARDRVEEIKKEMNHKLSEQKTELEKWHNDVISEKDKEIAIRDEKLNRLKMQMADALKGNSWERQQQLEELTKELARIQDESDLLRMKLKAYSKNRPGSCSNCPDLMSKLDRAHLTVKDREHTIKELKSLVVKFEKQLNQQDQLLKHWAESKGHPLTKHK